MKKILLLILLTTIIISAYPHIRFIPKGTGKCIIHIQIGFPIDHHYLYKYMARMGFYSDCGLTMYQIIYNN